MRPDFIKVLTERPRHASSMKYKDKSKIARRRKIGEDDFGGSEPMQRGGHKEFSDLLGPLYRYVESRVGKPWDKSYSEICAHLKGRNTVQQHLLGHLEHYVETKHSDVAPRWRGLSDFYVDGHGILRRRKKVKFRPKKEPVTKFKSKAGLEYEKIDGIWYRVWTVTEYFNSNPMDPFDYVAVPSIRRRQLGSKLLRALKIANDFEED